MRPSRIRVFDGLRVTTEHLDHLQSAFGSAVEDLREIAGLATVQHGFEVSVAEGQVTVAPGLAFDRDGNRIACDEPRTLPIAFERIDESKFVCVRYQQVEDGIVEGHPTLIFDSCDVVLESAMPGEADSLVPIARLVNTSAGIEVRPIEETPDAPAPPAPETAPVAAQIWVRQGVVRMTGPAGEIAVDSLPRSLGEQEIVFDASPLSISAHVLVLATVSVASMAADLAVADGSAPAPAASEPLAARAECRADGEAVFDVSGVSQFSLSAYPAAEFSEGDLARVYLETPASSGIDALRSAYLAVRIQRSLAGTITVGCSLEWAGTAAEESIQAVRDRKPSLSWQTLFAWKALGGSAGH